MHHHMITQYPISYHIISSPLLSHCHIWSHFMYSLSLFLQDRYISKVMSGTEGGVSSSSSVSVLSSRSYKCRLNMPVRPSEFSSNAICSCCYMLATVHTVARVAYSSYKRINTCTRYICMTRCIIWSGTPIWKTTHMTISGYGIGLGHEHGYTYGYLHDIVSYNTIHLYTYNTIRF